MLLAWLMRNSLKIGLIAAVLTVIGVVGVRMIPFPYKATAIVLADPRDQRITLQEDVLPSIGTDAAVLESMVQIARSDGFLIEVMRNLGLFVPGPAGLTSEEQSRQLARFRRDIVVERKGATYLVEISYRADNGEEAARVANGIAEAFADSQNDSRSSATENATRNLSAQLVEIRARLNESEEAVARFRVDNGIVYVDERNTVQMRQLGELNQQLALARNATEEARARYEEHRNGGALTRTGQAGDGEGGQLSFLRQQRAQLLQMRDQQLQVYGQRHPRLVQTQQTLDGVEREIVRERRLVAEQIRAELDVAVSKQGQLERQIGELSDGVSLTDTARVQLDALEREAAANREIYQQLLNRNKATDQLALLSSDNVRIVSAAIAPIFSTRPSIVLLGPVIAFLSLCVAIAGVVAANTGRLRKKPVAKRKLAPPRAPASTSHAARPQPYPQPVPQPQRPARPSTGGSLLNTPLRPATARQAINPVRSRAGRDDISHDPYGMR